MGCSRYLFSIWNWCVRKIYWRDNINNLDELSDSVPDDKDSLVLPDFDKQVIIELLNEYDE
jgi:hypothetical protein